MRSSSAEPSSNSWLPTAVTSSPRRFIASIVGSSWNSADTSGLAPIRSPAETTSVRCGFVASRRLTCVARLATPPASVSSISPDDPLGGSRLPWKSLKASSWTPTVPSPLCPCAAGAAISSPASTAGVQRPTRIPASRCRRVPATRATARGARRTRSASRTARLLANSSWPREAKRVYSAALSTGAETPSSIAAWTVQRPSPESDTRPEKSSRSGPAQQRRGGQVEQPRADDAAAPPDLGDLGEVEVVLVELGLAQRRRLGVLQALLVRRYRRGAGRSGPRRRRPSSRTRSRCGPSSRSARRRPGRSAGSRARRGSGRPRGRACARPRRRPGRACARSARCARRRDRRRRPSGCSRARARRRRRSRPCPRSAVRAARAPRRGAGRRRSRSCRRR